VVYVGAVAVLFLFVVMMLDVDFASLRQGFAQYLPLALVIGVVLLIAMVGAIVLTLRHKPNVRRQKVAVQVGRRRKDAVAVVSVPTGEGISE
jgi:NADH-quinone oxidoreductase subunit J